MVLFDKEAANATIANVHENVALGVFGVILTIWIIISNSVLIISILVDDSRRRSVFCLHIVNLAVADLLVGVVVVPIITDYLLKGSWDLGEDVCQFSVITDVLLCTVSIIALVMINCDRFMFLTCPSVFLQRSRYIVCCLMIMIPWLVGLALVLPLWIMGKKYIGLHEGNCMLVLREDYMIPSLFVSFFVPAFLAVGVNVSIVLMLFVLRHRLDGLPLKRRVDSPKRQIVCICIVSLVFIAMWSPFFVVSLLMSVISYQPPEYVVVLTIWLGYLNSGVNPILWLVYPSVRKAIKSFVFCCSIKNDASTDVIDDEEDEIKRSMIEKDDAFELRDAIHS